MVDFIRCSFFLNVDNEKIAEILKSKIAFLEFIFFYLKKMSCGFLQCVCMLYIRHCELRYLRYKV